MSNDMTDNLEPKFIWNTVCIYGSWPVFFLVLYLFDLFLLKVEVILEPDIEKGKRALVWEFWFDWDIILDKWEKTDGYGMYRCCQVQAKPKI